MPGSSGGSDGASGGASGSSGGSSGSSGGQNGGGDAGGGSQGGASTNGSGAGGSQGGAGANAGGRAGTANNVPRYSGAGNNGAAGAGNYESRKRTREGVTYVRTVKLGKGIVRIEVEEPCTEEVFAQLWPLTEGRRLTKRRYAIEDGERIWEIDEFTDRELFLAEVELPTEETEVVIPEWLAPCLEREVTGEDTYVNANLAR